jgi:DNA primase
MPIFSPTLIQDVLARVSIVELVRTRVQLHKKGATWKGLCPFHQEKTPSFVVNEARKSFHCFGCGKGGDAISFLRELEGLGFIDAISELADRAGVPLPKEEMSPQDAARANRRDMLHRANSVAATHFNKMLNGDEGIQARDYLAERGFDLEFANKAKLGVAPDSWDSLYVALRAAGLDPRTGEEAGLLVPKKGGGGHYDRFRNRLMFPITERGGKIVAFGGRTLGDDTAKYINSPESPIYNKSRALYGLHEARSAIHRADKVLVVEGYFDVLGLARVGIDFAVAPCGTALTEQQVRALAGHAPREVILLFDSDQAGRKAAMRALPICLMQGLWPSYLAVPDGKDPDDFAREHGAEAVQELVNSARPLLDVFIEDTLPGPSDGPQAADEALVALCPILVMLKPVQQANSIRHVARSLGIDVRLVEDMVRREGSSQRTRTRTKKKPERESDRTAPTRRRGATTPTEQSRAGRAQADPHGPPAIDDQDYFPGADDPDQNYDHEDFSGGIATEPTAPQRQLVRLMIQDLPEIAPLVEQLQVTQWLNHADVERIVARLLHANREGRVPQSNELMSDIRDNTLLTEISEVLTSEEAWFPADRLEQATRECMVRLRLEWMLRQRARLARDLGAQERSGKANPGMLLEIARQLTDLDRDVERARVHLGSL